MLRACTLAVAALAVATAPARAATYCVERPDCPAGGIEADTPEEAAAAANAAPGPDDVLVGPGRYEISGVSASGSTQISGAGAARTVFVGRSGVPLSVVAFDEGARVSDLTLELHDGIVFGVDADFGGTLERVVVDGSAMTKPAVAVLGGLWAFFRQGRVVMPHGIAVTHGIEVEDSVLEAAIGVYEGDYHSSVKRSVIRAEIGALAEGRGISIADTAIQVAGENPVGMRSTGKSGLDVATLRARNLTIVGPGHGIGVDVSGDCDSVTGGLDATGIALAGFETHLRLVQRNQSTSAGECYGPATLKVRRSAFDAERVHAEGPGVVDVDAPVTTELGLIDAAGGDLRPRWDSPLIDAGGFTASDQDARGLPRVGPPDIGAYEYQFAAPVAHAAVTPPRGEPGDTFTFDARASSDVDGDPLTFAWTFSQGAPAQEPVVERVFGAGERWGTVTVTDVTGRSSSATATVGVEPPAAQPRTTEAESVPGAAPATTAPAGEVLAAQADRIRPRGITVRPRRLRVPGIRYRLRGRVVLPAGVETGRCAGAHVVIRVPTRPGRDRARFARVNGECRFRMRITIPARYLGGFVRLYPLFRGAETLTPVRGRPVTLRPR